MDDYAKQLEDEILNYTSDCEEENVGTCFVERTEKIHRNSDKEAIVTECSEHSDATECSSSFDGSDCGAEGVDTLDDPEVSSGFRGGNESALVLDGLLAARKKLSSHWRSFIYPLMWRCKWVELQINKLVAQSREYDKKLQRYSQKNPVQLEATTSEGHGLNAPTSSQNTATNGVLRRRKRRQAEATDRDGVQAYMSRHSLFSYYDAPKEVNNDVELGDGELFCIEAGSCEKSLEDLLQKTVALQSRVLKLKTRAEKVVVSEQQAGKPSSADTLCSPPPPPPPPPPRPLSRNASLSLLDPSMIYRMPAETYLVSHLMSEYNFGGLLLPETGVLSNGEVVSDANGSRNLGHLANANEEDEEYDEEILIDNQRVKEELRYFDQEMKIHPFQKPWVLKEEDALGSTSIPQAPKGIDDQQQMMTRSSLNLANAPKSCSKSGKRKR